MSTNLKHVVLLLFILALVSVECRAADSLQELKEKAEQGDADTQYNLGVLCATGQGCRKTMYAPIYS